MMTEVLIVTWALAMSACWQWARWMWRAERLEDELELLQRSNEALVEMIVDLGGAYIEKVNQKHGGGRHDDD